MCPPHRYAHASKAACDATLPPTYDGIGQPEHPIHALRHITIEPVWRTEGGDCKIPARACAVRRDCGTPTMCYALRSDARAIAAPYPTAFNAPDDEALADHLEWMRRSPREALMAYVSGSHGLHPDFRAILHDECAASAACAHIECRADPLDRNPCSDHRAIIELLHGATYCLAPVGDTPTRQSWFDSILAGCAPPPPPPPSPCRRPTPPLPTTPHRPPHTPRLTLAPRGRCIPVFFSTCLRRDLLYETVYAPFLPTHERTAFGAGEWAVVLNATEVYEGRTVEAALRAIGDADVRRMQAALREIAPRLQYGNSSVSARSVLRAVLEGGE